MLRYLMQSLDYQQGHGPTRLYVMILESYDVMRLPEYFR
jgi:hypothetical protein